MCDCRRAGNFSPLRRLQDNITAADKKLVATEAQVDTQEKELCQTTKQSFGQLKAVLKQREMELLNKAACDSGPGEEGCSDDSEKESPNGRDRNREAGGTCEAECGEHERPRSDGDPRTTAGQDGGGRETLSATVSGTNHHCRHHLQPSLSQHHSQRSGGCVSTLTENWRDVSN